MPRVGKQQRQKLKIGTFGYLWQLLSGWRRKRLPPPSKVPAKGKQEPSQTSFFGTTIWKDINYVMKVAKPVGADKEGGGTAREFEYRTKLYVKGIIVDLDVHVGFRVVYDTTCILGHEMEQHLSSQEITEVIKEQEGTHELQTEYELQQTLRASELMAHLVQVGRPGCLSPADAHLRPIRICRG